MTITRLWQAGFESNGTGSLAEFAATAGSGLSISSTHAKSGTYALKLSAYGATSYGSVPIPATRQVRCAFHWRGAWAYSVTKAAIISWRSAAGKLGKIYITNAGLLVLQVAGSDVDSDVTPVDVSDWAHFAVDVKIDSSAGWVKVYKNGAEILTFSGNTGNADMVAVWLGTDDSDYHVGESYFDDCYVEDTTGEGAATIAPDRRFGYLTPNGNGSYSQCAGSDGNSTDNYALVDERPHTTDTDYVVADAVDERDTYALSNIALAAGWGVIAVIPVVYARKTDGAVDSKVALALYEDTTDWTGSEQALPTSYGPLWERRTTRPGGADWDEASVNALESGFVGKGTF